MVNLHCYGHACFALSDSKYNIIIDPFITDNPLCTTDAKDITPTHILVSHGHNDHLGDAIYLSKKNNAVIITTYELALYCQNKGANVHPMHIGGSHKFPFGTVKLTPAFHGSAVIEGDDIRPMGMPCGFIIGFNGKYVYHAGDTGLFGDMRLMGELYKLDCALLPIGDNFVMGPEDALIAAQMLQAKLTIPMHYNTFPVINQDPHAFINNIIKNKLKGIVLNPNEDIEIT